jgi:hypothetical protein
MYLYMHITIVDNLYVPVHVQVHTDYLRWLYACTGTYRLSMLVICMYRYIQIIYAGYMHVQVHTDYLIICMYLYMHITSVDNTLYPSVGFSMHQLHFQLINFCTDFVLHQNIYLNPALTLLGQGLKKSPIGQKLDFANHPYLCKGLI